MHHRLISEGKTARRISQDQPGCERENEGVGGDTAGFQESNLFVYCLGVLSVVTVHCSQPILDMLL